MNKYCSKCQKEIPQKSKNNLCENCQNKTNGVIRKVGEVALGLVVLLGSTVLWGITKGKNGGPRA